MQTLCMNSELLPTLLESLKSWGTLWAPRERTKEGQEKVYSLEVVDDVSLASPHAVRTIVPFKKLLLKPRFTMMHSTNGTTIENRDNDLGPQVFFGAHACDVHALKILDMLYLTDYIDPYYRRNREQLTVVGFGCWPDSKCFCQSLHTSTVDDAFDLYLTPLEGRFLVKIASSKGDDIIRAHKELFVEAQPRDTKDYLERLRKREKAFTLEMNVTDLPYILDLKREDPVWDELGRKCLCCGSCSMVCPTCSCFNVFDTIKSQSAERVRTWDACLYRDYAMVAGGHSFRENRADRVRNRYYHKQESFVREFGMPSCVGCGRCIDNCPTGINVVEVFQYVRGDL